MKGFIIENNVLLKLRRGKRGKIIKQLVVPEQLKAEVFSLCHDSFTGGHLGQFKTWRKLNARFYWPNVYQETINYVESCEVCAKLKSPPPSRQPLKPILDYEKPFDMLAVDVLELSLTTSGNRYALVFMDYLTRWAEVFPMKDMTSATIAKLFVNEVITRHGAPSKLLSDRGQNFLSGLMDSVYKYFKIHKINTCPYSPQTDGLVERFNRTLSTMLAAYSNSAQNDWDLHLPLVLFAYRTILQSTTGITPFGAVYGREARLGDLDNYNLGYEANDFIKNLRMQWQEAKINIEKQAEASKKNYDSKYKPIEYKEENYVRLKIIPTKI